MSCLSGPIAIGICTIAVVVGVVLGAALLLGTLFAGALAISWLSRWWLEREERHE